MSSATVRRQKVSAEQVMYFRPITAAGGNPAPMKNYRTISSTLNRLHSQIAGWYRRWQLDMAGISDAGIR
jgi:hypothetical protein